MPRSDVACPSGKQLLPEGGAGLEAMLEAGVTVAAVDAGELVRKR